MDFYIGMGYFITGIALLSYAIRLYLRRRMLLKKVALITKDNHEARS